MGKTFWKRIGLLFLLSLFLLFSCWWYGLFTDIGKTVKEPYDLDKIQYPDGIINLDYPDPMIDLKKQLSKMPTRTVVETLLEWSGNRVLARSIYERPLDSLEYYLEQNTSGQIVKELFSRNNAASVLLDFYSNRSLISASDFKETNVPSKVGMLELLLVSPNIQRHILPKDRNRLPQIVFQKQIEKFSEQNYYYGEYNYFYLDAYHYDYESDFSSVKGAEGWDYMLIKERADFITVPQKQHHVLECLEKMWPAVTRADDWKRFDDCQI